jgi:hypothetical protein
MDIILTGSPSARPHIASSVLELGQCGDRKMARTCRIKLATILILIAGPRRVAMNRDHDAEASF